jgi:predicted nucleotidyltransferase
MNLQELENFKLTNAIQFHDVLNPVLFRDEHMISAVRDRLLEIADDFMEHLGVNNIDVKDITLSGSNASYTYTPHSDIDLHILVDIKKLNHDEIYAELFHVKKIIWNLQHDITIGGYEVELYVQDSAQPVVSRGEYSVLNDRWIKFPTKRVADINEPASKSKFEKLVQVAELALKARDMDKIEAVLDTIRKYRKAGLESQGEFSPENIAFKALRTSGLLHRLRDAYNEIHSQTMSMAEKGPKILDKPTLSISDLAKKHGVSRKHIIGQLKKGIKVELEHTSIRDVATEIALDHLSEDPNYYTKLVKANLEEGASGYIPSEAEKNDPRFKTALTVDIKPDSIRQNAIKLGLGKIKRSGIPPIAKPSGKF